jgi:hypothetical protein
MRLRLAIMLVALVALAGVAHAYPQYQMSKEQSCGACHLSPVGGGLLNGYGELTAEEESQWGGDPAFLHGAIELPDWLALGGDIRFAAGPHERGAGIGFAAIPMQSELYVSVARGPVSAFAMGGITIEGESFKPWSREHYVMWKQSEGEGFYARAGRFMPVVGLRFPEHPFLIRRYGGTPLFGETYGANVGWISPGLDVHVTGFIADPLIAPIEEGDGAAVYVEKRFGNKSIGLIDRYTTSDVDTRIQGGLTGKIWLEGSKLLLSAEGQAVRQDFKLTRGPTRVQLVGQLLATYFLRPGLWIDAGLGHFDEDVAVADLDRDTVDVNVHWFPISHLELVLMNRVQLIGLGGGGETSGFSLLQLHYRI